MRLIRRSVPVPLAAALAAAASFTAMAPPAYAQGSGMNCYAMAGGRASCTLGSNALIDRLGADVAERNASIAARERRLVRKVAEAVRDGHCAEALELALKATDPMVAANTARLCGVPDPDAAPRTEPPRP